MPLGGALLGLGGAAAIAGSIYSGNKAASAAKDAARIQAQSGQAAIDEARAAREESAARLLPYEQFGVAQLTPLAQMISPQGQIDYLQNNPIFQASLKNMNEQVLNNAAVRGRLNAGDTRQRFADNFQAAALPLLNYQTNNLFNAAQLGQASAAGQANNALTTSANIGNTLTGIGNAQAAGIVGAANARGNMIKDITGGLTSIYGMYG